MADIPPVARKIPPLHPMALTDTACRNAKAVDKAFKLSDSAGLYLLVNPSGGKLWRFKYRFAGKEKLLALGSYPQIALKDARVGYPTCE